MQNKKVLVVGGAGFIGSHVNKMLRQAGYETLVFDNLSLGNALSVAKSQFVLGDICQEDELNTLFTQNQFDGVMHFAAFTDVGESMTDPSSYYINNVSNTIKLLNAMRAHHVKYFIFSSSAAVYGIPNQQSIDETHPCQPINPYGQTKLIVEKILHDYDRAYGLKFCALRYFNAAGGDPEREIKNLKTKENNLIPLILRSIKGGDGSITVFGTDYPTFDGTCIRDYIHVCDLGTAHIKALEHLWNGSESTIFNLGNGNGFSVKQVIETVQNVTGFPVKVIEGPRRPGDPPYLLANSTKAKKELGWNPVYPDLETIVAHAWKAQT
jgi:UDP-glucose 4-epimerase